MRSLRRFARHALPYAALLFAFSLPLSHAGISLATGLITLLWLLGGGFERAWHQIKVVSLFTPLALLPLYLALTLLWSDAPHAGAKELLNYLYYWPLIPMLYTSLQPRDVHRLISAFLLGMLISELISYGIYFEWWHKADIPPSNPSPFMHHIIYSIFLAITALLILQRILFQKEPRWQKILLGLFFMSVSTNLFINWGRTGQVAFIVTLFLILLHRTRPTLKGVLLSTLATLLLASVAYLLSPQLQRHLLELRNDLHTMRQTGNYDTSTGGRIAMEIVGVQIVRHHPIFGAGIGEMKEQMRKTVAHPEYAKFRFILRYDHLHNEYLVLLVQGGGVALVLLLWLFFRLLETAQKEPTAYPLALITTGVYLTGFWFEPLLRRQFSMALFVFMVILVLLQSQSAPEAASR